MENSLAVYALQAKHYRPKGSLCQTWLERRFVYAKSKPGQFLVCTRRHKVLKSKRAKPAKF